MVRCCSSTLFALLWWHFCRLAHFFNFSNYLEGKSRLLALLSESRSDDVASLMFGFNDSTNRILCQFAGPSTHQLARPSIGSTTPRSWPKWPLSLERRDDAELMLVVFLSGELNDLKRFFGWFSLLKMTKPKSLNFFK